MSTFEITPEGEVSDGHHTFSELYRYRLLYNAALFSEWAKLGLYDVHKSMFHHDGTIPFGDRKWFIVVAELPTGQISNHYKIHEWRNGTRYPNWDLFKVPEKDLPNEYDGHTPAVAANRLETFLYGPHEPDPKTMLTIAGVKASITLCLCGNIWVGDPGRCALVKE